MVVNDVAVLTPQCGKTGMKGVINLMRPPDTDVAGQIGIGAELPLVHGTSGMRVEVNDLSDGMNTGIRPACTDYPHGMIGDF